jgi:hypothetical protein
MGYVSRRTFLETLAASGAAAAARGEVSTSRPVGTKSKNANASDTPIDFRYAPRLSQATICFPDDPKKSLVGQAGDLRYGFINPPMAGMENFATVCTFSLGGMQDDRVSRQWLEAPHIPIVHTFIERPTATVELMAFSTRHADEGRVDNVLMTILPKQAPVATIPRIHIRDCRSLKQSSGPPAIAINEANSNALFLVAAKMGPTLDYATFWDEEGYTLYLPHGKASHGKPLQYRIRFPQEGQSVDALQEILQQPDILANEAREFWTQWKPFGSTAWSYPGRAGEFLTVCARNIQQAREVKNGRLVFEVGPTVYRNLLDRGWQFPARGGALSRIRQGSG